MSSQSKLSDECYNDLVRRSIKIVDISLTTCIQFIVAFYISTLLDHYVVGQFDKTKMDKTPVTLVIGEIVLHYSLLGIVAYIARNTIPLIPFPLNKIRGFDHSKVKEVNNPVFFAAIMLLNQKNLQAKTAYLYSRVTGYLDIVDSKSNKK